MCSAKFVHKIIPVQECGDRHGGLVVRASLVGQENSEWLDHTGNKSCYVKKFNFHPIDCM